MPEYQRIVSLVPSLTELLIDLGLKEQLVGRTRFCIHPEKEVQDIEIIGGTKNPNIEKILSLDPDFILANKEENQKEDIAELSMQVNVRVTDIATINEALIAIFELGNLFDKKEKAEKLIAETTSLIDQKPESQPLRTAYLIWKDPWMTIGNDTYIHDVLETYELENVYGEQKRYPKISLKELAVKNPDFILLSSEPYPFKEKHKAELRESFPSAKIELVNGQWFSWYGSRMPKAFKQLNEWRKKA
ncbi:MAG: helical backbone metal receptor [Balneolaceae bacterium]